MSPRHSCPPRNGSATQLSAAEWFRGTAVSRGIVPRRRTFTKVRGGHSRIGTSDEFQIEEAMISSSSAECADDGMH